MHIYLVECPKEHLVRGMWGFYRAFVCIAPNEDEARALHPNPNEQKAWLNNQEFDSDWPSYEARGLLKVTLLGNAFAGDRQVILSNRRDTD